MNLEARLEGLVTTAELAGRPDFKLGGAIVSPSSRTLSGPGGKVDVEPRVMQLLVVLADAEGAVVTRETLFRRCWGSRSVSDDSLNRAVGALRRIAAGIAGGSFEVETIPRTGYRLTTSPAAGVATRGPPATRRGVIAAGLATAAVGAGFLGNKMLGGEAQDPRVVDLIARSEVASRNGAVAGGAKAVSLLEQAVRLQPSNARAWGRLALARSIAAEYAPPGTAAATVAATQEAAQRALSLDGRQPDAHAALALLTPYYGDWAAAERRMNSVLAIDPEHLPTRDARAFMHVGVGRAREGSLDRLRMAAREPLHVEHQFKLVYAHWILGDIAAADRAADRALQLWPTHTALWLGRLWTLAFTGRAERALAQINDTAGLPRLPPGMADVLRQAMIALAGRRPADVERAVQSVLGLLGQGPSHSVNAMMILNGLGEVDRAFDVASAYLLERGPLLANVRWRPGQLTVDQQRRRKTNMLFVPVAAPMQSDPRFMKLVTEIGLADYWQKLGVTPDFLSS